MNITKGLYDRYETKFQTNINQFPVILIKNRESHCGDLNESGLHRLIYLNGWSPVGRMFGKIRKCGLVEEGASLGVDFGI